MPRTPTKGKTMFAAELPTDLVEQFREYVKSRGEKVTFALERAIRREMTYPPPPPVPPTVAPLPDVPTGAVVEKSPAKGKAPAKGRKKRGA